MIIPIRKQRRNVAYPFVICYFIRMQWINQKTKQLQWLLYIIIFSIFLSNIYVWFVKKIQSISQYYTNNIFLAFIYNIFIHYGLFMNTHFIDKPHNNILITTIHLIIGACLCVCVFFCLCVRVCMSVRVYILAHLCMHLSFRKSNPQPKIFAYIYDIADSQNSIRVFYYYLRFKITVSVKKINYQNYIVLLFNLQFRIKLL